MVEKKFSILSIVTNSDFDGLAIIDSLLHCEACVLFPVLSLEKTAVASENLFLGVSCHSFELPVGIDERTIFLIGIHQRDAINGTVQDLRQDLRDQSGVFFHHKGHFFLLDSLEEWRV